MLYNYYSPYNLNFLVGMFNQLKKSFTERLKTDDKERTIKIIHINLKTLCSFLLFYGITIFI
jgi:hypothetical protein